jgi:predicted secreted protein
MVGVGGEQELRFMARAEGFATLRLVYVRPWEKDVPPADVAVFAITVARSAPRG